MRNRRGEADGQCDSQQYRNHGELDDCEDG